MAVLANGFDSSLPALNSDIVSTEVRTNFAAIETFLEGNNQDENNVDYTSTDGIMVLGQAQTATGLKTWENTAAAAGGIRTVAQFTLNPSSGTPAANDGWRIAGIMDDAGGTASNIGFIDLVMTTATAGSEVGRWDFYVAAGAGSAVSQVQIRDGSFVPTTTNDVSLGIATLGFSDLHLGSGGVINWVNGEVTVTETDANTLTLAGATTLDLGAVATLDFDGVLSITTVGALTLNPTTDVILPDDKDLALGTGADSLLSYNGTNTVWNLRAVGTGNLLLNNGIVIIGDGTTSANGGMTIGLTIDQRANDDQVLAFKSSDVAHAMTGIVATDTFGRFTKSEGTSGGMWVEGFKDADGSAALALVLLGSLGEAADTTDTSGSTGIIDIRGRVTDGAASVTDVAATGNVISFRNNGTAVGIVKGNGDWHITNTTLVALDNEPDALVMRAGRALLAPPGSFLHDNFKHLIDRFAHKLEEHRIMFFERDEHGAVTGAMNNIMPSIMLAWDGLYQQHMKIEELESRIQRMEAA